MRLINIMTLCAVCILAHRICRVDRKTDKLRSDTGAAFAATTRHLERMVSREYDG